MKDRDPTACGVGCAVRTFKAFKGAHSAPYEFLLAKQKGRLAAALDPRRNLRA